MVQGNRDKSCFTQTQGGGPPTVFFIIFGKCLSFSPQTLGLGPLKRGLLFACVFFDSINGELFLDSTPPWAQQPHPSSQRTQERLWVGYYWLAELVQLPVMIVQLYKRTWEVFSFRFAKLRGPGDEGQDLFSLILENITKTVHLFVSRLCSLIKISSLHAFVCN